MRAHGHAWWLPGTDLSKVELRTMEERQRRKVACQQAVSDSFVSFPLVILQLKPQEKIQVAKMPKPNEEKRESDAQGWRKTSLPETIGSPNGLVQSPRHVAHLAFLFQEWVNNNCPEAKRPNRNTTKARRTRLHHEQV